MKLAILFLCIFCFGVNSFELQNGTGLKDSEFTEKVKKHKLLYPQLWVVLDQISDENVNIKFTHIKNGSAGRAKGRKNIALNYKHFFDGYKSFTEARLIVVALHEYGHVLFNRENGSKKSTVSEREYVAFKYSFLHSLKLADNGYVEPLRQLQHNLQVRLKKGKKLSPHNVAIKQLIKEKPWLEAMNKHD